MKLKSKTENVRNKYVNAYETHKTKRRHTNSIGRWQRQGQRMSYNRVDTEVRETF